MGREDADLSDGVTLHTLVKMRSLISWPTAIPLRSNLDRPPCRAGCEPFEIVPQQRLCIEHLKHLVCVVAPVGGAVEHAAWPQATSGKVRRIRAG